MPNGSVCRAAAPTPLPPTLSSPIPVGPNEREICEETVVSASPDGKGVVSPVGVIDIHHAAETDGFRSTEA